MDQAPDRACRYLDKRRRRTSILQNSRADWPIFLPHDEIRPFSGSLEDFVYVDVPTPTTFAEMWSLAPLRGPGWYHWTAADTAIHYGKVQLSQVRWVIKASLHITADKISSVVTEAMSPFEDVDVRLGDGSEMNAELRPPFTLRAHGQPVMRLSSRAAAPRTAALSLARTAGGTSSTKCRASVATRATLGIAW